MTPANTRRAATSFFFIITHGLREPNRPGLGEGASFKGAIGRENDLRSGRPDGFRDARKRAGKRTNRTLHRGETKACCVRDGTYDALGLSMRCVRPLKD